MSHEEVIEYARRTRPGDEVDAALEETRRSVEQWEFTPEQLAALERHGYASWAAPRGVTGDTKVFFFPPGDWVFLRNRVCVLDGIEIDGHEGSDLDPGGNSCIHCGDPLWSGDDD